MRAEFAYGLERTRPQLRCCVTTVSPPLALDSSRKGPSSSLGRTDTRADPFIATTHSLWEYTSIHKVAVARHTVEARGATRVQLPLYRSDLNRIE